MKVVSESENLRVLGESGSSIPFIPFIPVNNLSS